MSDLQGGSMSVTVGKARIEALAQEMHADQCGCGEAINAHWLRLAEEVLVREEREKKVAKRTPDHEPP